VGAFFYARFFAVVNSEKLSIGRSKHIRLFR